MIPKQVIFTISMIFAAFLPSGCRHGGNARGVAEEPPDARRPVLKSEAELAAERQDRLESGAVVATEPPRLESSRVAASASNNPLPPPIRPNRDSIRSDVLMVNKTAVTVAEVLYPMRDWIEETRANQTPRGFLEILRTRIQDQVRNEIGSILVFEKALSDIPEERRKQLDEFVTRELDQRISQNFGDSRARFEQHLKQYGLTLEQAREMVKRRMMVSSYSREILAPQLHVRRDELLEYYRRNQSRYTTAATRELRLISAPFAKFLPDDIRWDSASEAAQSRAKLQALRHIRSAHEALAERDFADVAGEYSKDAQAGNGGSWGRIGAPLRAPLDVVSSRVFEMQAGQYTEPIETADGWYIAQCGEIVEAAVRPFTDVQEEIREELENARFGKLAGEYIYKLAERATITDLSGFIEHAVERAFLGWSPETTRQ